MRKGRSSYSSEALMAEPLRKVPILLTPAQVNLVGQALTEYTWQLASRISHAGQTEPTPEEVSLLKAYIEVAKIIIASNVAPAGESATDTP